MAYFDEYWCIIFILDAARRVVAKEVVAPARRLATIPAVAIGRPLGDTF
jgi:hypothetical protein